MTDLELRIRVAELRGFHKRPDSPQRGIDGSLPWWSPDGSWLAWDDWSLPDYFYDLNAMNEAERYWFRLRRVEDPELVYRRALRKVAGAEFWYATARQRAEAYVKVMEQFA
jgi:hypothetical protein